MGWGAGMACPEGREELCLVRFVSRKDKRITYNLNKGVHSIGRRWKYADFCFPPGRPVKLSLSTRAFLIKQATGTLLRHAFFSLDDPRNK